MGQPLTILSILERCWRFECLRQYLVRRDFKQQSPVTGNYTIKAGWFVTWSPYYRSILVRRNEEDPGVHHNCDASKFKEFVEAGVFETIPE